MLFGFPFFCFYCYKRSACRIKKIQILFTVRQPPLSLCQLDQVCSNPSALSRTFKAPSQSLKAREPLGGDIRERLSAKNLGRVSFGALTSDRSEQKMQNQRRTKLESPSGEGFRKLLSRKRKSINRSFQSVNPLDSPLHLPPYSLSTLTSLKLANLPLAFAFQWRSARSFFWSM
jgi:hypothetical protein